MVVLGPPSRGVWYYFVVVWVLKEPVLLLAPRRSGDRAHGGDGALWTDSDMAYLVCGLA